MKTSDNNTSCDASRLCINRIKKSSNVTKELNLYPSLHVEFINKTIRAMGMKNKPDIIKSISKC